MALNKEKKHISLVFTCHNPIFASTKTVKIP